jgi:hypothetical protein
MQDKGTETCSGKDWPEGGYNCIWLIFLYGILRITKLIGLLEFYVYYVYNANEQSAYHLQSTALIYFSQFCKLLIAAGNVTRNTRPSEARGLSPPPIIYICISKTQKITWVPPPNIDLLPMAL